MGNPQLASLLSSDAGEGNGAAESTAATVFTPADMLALVSAFEGSFWPLALDYTHEALLPLSEYLALPQESRARVVPYLRMLDAEGVQRRVACARRVVDSSERHLSGWRALQELAGIGNSIIDARVAETTAQLAAQKEQEAAALRAQYEQRLEQQLKELAEAMMRRLAAGLLNRASEVSSAPPAAPAAAPGAARSQAAPAAAPVASPAGGPAPEPEEEEEDVAPLDDPYIDTPLCTSCNECTNLNGKLFAYNENKQALIKDINAGTYRELVIAAEKCPVRIIHPGKPRDPNEPELEALVARAKAFN